PKPARSLAASGAGPDATGQQPTSPSPAHRNRQRTIATTSLIALAAAGCSFLLAWAAPGLVLLLIALIALVAAFSRRSSPRRPAVRDTLWLRMASAAGLLTILIPALVVSGGGAAGHHWWWSLVIAAGAITLTLSERLRRHDR
ncbi:hypothetical protein, partial [Streptomyces griseorubiginosus]|uniref:hypothetical protein n=1 Tax=Streptomyces griseorubiginosus TaxID=67304 RepID=UPI001AD623DC